MTSHATAKRIEAEANRFGFFLTRSDGHDNGHRATWQIKCGYCPMTKRFYGWSSNTSPDMMVKNARQQMWKVGLGDKPECPTCAYPKKAKPNLPVASNVVPIKKSALMGGVADTADTTDTYADALILALTLPVNVEDVDVREKTEIKKKENTMPETMTETINAAMEITKTPSPKIMRAVFEGLAAYFDEKAHLYTGGYSDLKLAKEIGTSEDFVARLRRESYGELAEDPMITSLRNAINTLDMKMGQQASDNATYIRELRSRVEQMSAKTKSK